MGTDTTTGSWTQDPISGLEDWRDWHRRSLFDHPAVTQHGHGVDPRDLSAFIMSLAALAAERVQGIGAEQYGGEIQKFETKSVEELKVDILEEAADIIAYGAMLAIKALA